MGGGGTNTSTGLTKPQDPNRPVTTVMGKPVSYNQTIQGSQGFDAKKWEKATSGNKPITSSMAQRSQSSNASIPTSQVPTFSPEHYTDYGFSAQSPFDYGDPASFYKPESGAIWGDKENEDSLEQFLQWQRKMGY